MRARPVRCRARGHGSRASRPRARSGACSSRSVSMPRIPRTMLTKPIGVEQFRQFPFPRIRHDRRADELGGDEEEHTGEVAGDRATARAAAENWSAVATKAFGNAMKK